jgi:hypothetical protein
MTIDAATAATLKHGSAGPKTEVGKAKSSRNSIRTGLYAARDFVRPEEEEYAQTLIKLMDELTPENSVEQTFATEIGRPRESPVPPHPAPLPRRTP